MSVNNLMAVYEVAPSQDLMSKIDKPVNKSLVKVSKVNRFGTGEYLPVSAYKKLVNEICGHQWSWEILTKEVIRIEGKPPFVEVLGRLTIPGLGVQEAYGAQPLNTPDASQSSKMAASYAFKNACKMFGIGDLDDDDDVFGDEDNGSKTQNQAKANTNDARNATNAANAHAPQTQNQTQAQGQVKKTAFTPEQIQKMKDLKEAYNIKDNSELVPFLKMWDATCSVVTDLHGGNIDNFITWATENMGKMAEELKI